MMGSICVNYIVGILISVAQKRENENCKNKSRVLIFRDSYTTELIQFISLHFTEVIYVNERYSDDLINKINPDIVVSCKVEKYMSLL
ncbi:hypothetical protein [Aquimarina algiphila]|uniref:hypothetical protein n=1 Tax=Aquimarina algiphila TaxID=2047982 RepID=UPI002330E19D|nr:hypothetical protein [Aquimarina algiphila]